ncbi:diacylglycerol kinase [Porticoccaceae bacterium]|jgi:diacylglycerol kinase (ATP)|nr:diacylglycerol kinase [Porticoccaceae bacterium]
MLKRIVAIFYRRFIVAGVNSSKGLKDAFRKEEAFRVQVLLGLLLIPLACFIANSYLQLLLLLLVYLLVMIVELLNTCIEIVVDRISPEFNELSGRAKDIGSAAVALSMFLFVLVWGTLIGVNLGFI